jgi:hypothetical protein
VRATIALMPVARSRSPRSGPHLADSVAKVENRATRKISRKLIFGLLCRCVAFQRHYGGPWSILDETIWSLTSPLVKRISDSKKFRSSPQKDFCNNICQKRTSSPPSSYSTYPDDSAFAHSGRSFARARADADAQSYSRARSSTCQLLSLLVRMA